MMLTSSSAVLPCQDFDRTIAFYTDIGFDLQGKWGDPTSYVIFEKDAVEIHFANDPGHLPERANVAVYIRTNDVDTWSDALGVLPIWTDTFPRFGPAEDRAWGMREMHILDPDGHLLRVGQHING